MIIDIHSLVEIFENKYKILVLKKVQLAIELFCLWLCLITEKPTSHH